jgi:hypothetical protein
MSDNLNVYGTHKVSIIILLVFVIFIYIIIFSILHKNETSSGWVFIIEIILWVTLIVIIVVNIKWLNDKDFNISAEIHNLFNSKMTELDIFGSDSHHDKHKKDKDPIKPIQPIQPIKPPDVSYNVKDISNSCITPMEVGEVFHIEDNTYSYDDAKNVCTLLGSRLATYDEMEKAYQNGANWCSYGWSDEQLALFPIQKSLYNELKTIKGHQHDCGRTGVNGGYIEDSSTAFGVNCYGKKPYMTDKDKDFMNNYTYTPTMSEVEKQKLDNSINDILIAPFNKTKWNY